jgi:hypothetical protein
MKNANPRYKSKPAALSRRPVHDIHQLEAMIYPELSMQVICALRVKAARHRAASRQSVDVGGTVLECGVQPPYSATVYPLKCFTRRNNTLFL